MIFPKKVDMTQCCDLPISALKLPLCKLSKDFASSHGITTEKPSLPSVQRRLPSTSSSSGRFVPPRTTTEAAATTTTTKAPLRTSRPRPRFNTDGACKGLRFCTLRKNRLGANDPPPPRQGCNNYPSQGHTKLLLYLLSRFLNN